MKTNTETMTVYVDESPVGTGKTYNAISNAITFPARYLFATERLLSVLEIEERARVMAFDRGVNLTIRTIVSTPSNRGASVATAVAAIPTMFANASNHTLFIITHAALMMTDLSGFAGWHVIIDEVPGILVQQTLRTRTDRDFFERNYRLEHINGQWSRVALSEVGKGMTSRDLSHCQSHAHLLKFHQLVAGELRPVVCNLQEWSDMERPRSEWTWWNLFDIRQLEAFDSVKFLGSGFMSKLAAKILQNFDPDVAWIVSSRSGDRNAPPKTANIYYFTDAYASKYYFESAHGQEHLAQIAQYLASVMPIKSIWSANNPDEKLTARRAMEPHMGHSRYLSPKQSGTNEFMSYHDAAIIYASRPSRAHKAALETLGCTEQDWIETNEYETILQFLTRTSVRDLTRGGTTNLYVLSRDQADYLMAFMGDQPHITAHLNRIDLGFEYPDTRMGRPRIVLSPQEAREKAEGRRKAKAAAERQRRARIKAEASL